MQIFQESPRGYKTNHHPLERAEIPSHLPSPALPSLTLNLTPLLPVYSLTPAYIYASSVFCSCVLSKCWLPKQAALQWYASAVAFAIYGEFLVRCSPIVRVINAVHVVTAVQNSSSSYLELRCNLFRRDP